ncbi:MAG TPA: LamG-like jellyroll fold domain-containing protein, partial [Hanamia sp.]
MKWIFFIFLLIYRGVGFAQVNCNNWLNTPAVPSFVDIGKLNVTGNQITVEAVINRTTSYLPGGQDYTEGDVVSKHDNPTDVNYLLRPNHAYITTTNGFFATPDIADLNLNQTYHIAMVYDGDTLRFYRDGCLMSKIAASGDLYQNNWDTRIGFYQDQIWKTNFIGYINEVRIWNVARTQAQIQAYMNSSLPNPTAQPGLLAYYTFDNLLNKQGNPSWNGTLGGSASINQTNTKCNAIINNCPVPPPVCNTLITKRADTTICAASSVNMSATGGTSFFWSPAAGLSNPNLANTVASPIATTKYYVMVSDVNGCSKLDSVTINVNALPVISKSNDTGICVNSHAPIFASGGTSYLWSPVAGLSNPNSPSPVATPLTSTKYYVTVTNATGCSKKDSVNITVNSLPVITKSNDTAICLNSQAMLFASGGTSYAWSPSVGLSNPSSATPVAMPLSTTKYYVTVSNGGCAKEDSVKITVKNLPLISKSNDTSICINAHVPMFASGGTSYLWSPSAGLSNPNLASPLAIPLTSTKYYVTVTNATGCSKKDSVLITVNNLPAIVKSKDTSICLNSQTTLSASGGSSYTWSPSAGLSNPNISKPVASPLISTKYFVIVTTAAGCSKNDSVQVTVNSLPVIVKSNDTAVCKNTQAQLLASGGTIYSWSPANSLSNANIFNPVAKPLSNTIYQVKVTNVNGCSETASVNVNIKPVPAITKSNDTLICNRSSVKIFATGGISYGWSPAATLDHPTQASSMASPSTTTIYYVQITDAQACVYNDSVKVSVRPPAVFAVSADKQICENTKQQLTASGGDTYLWSPASFLDNQNVSNPIASPEQTTTYSVTITESACNESATLSTQLTVLAAPTVHAMRSNDITCTEPSTHLTALGAQNYSWTPTDGLNDANIANPVASPQHSTVYYLTGKDQNGCPDTDSVYVKVDYDKDTFYGLPNSFTPN